MQPIRFILLYILLVSAILANEDIDIRVNYFGNITASKLSESGYTLNNYIHDNVEDKTSLTPYSKLGGQVSVLYDKYTFTTQALIRKNHGEYDPELTWFNIKYDFNENTFLKIGRIQATILQNSDSLDIDYVHLWSKPPDEVYRLLGINTFDGIELSYKDSIGDYDYNIMLTPYARTKKDINTTVNLETPAIIDNAMIAKINIERGPFVFQGSYTKGDLNLPDEDPSLITLQNALSSLDNDVSRFSYVEKEFNVWTLGIKYTYENFIFNSEYARMKSTGLAPDMKAYFVLFGYRYDKFTPFFMYARNKVDKEHFDTSSISVTPGTQYLKDSLDDVLYSTNTSQKTLSLGLRYDLKPGIAITAQVDKTTASTYGKEGSLNKRGILEYELGLDNKPVYLYTIGVSFAF